MKIQKTIEEELPFDLDSMKWDIISRNLIYNLDDPDEFEEFMEWVDDTYSREEVLANKEDIQYLIDKHKKSIEYDMLSDLDFQLDNCLEYVSKENILEYVKAYLNID